MGYSVGMVSLGCPKNQVDAEILLACLKNAGFEIRSSEYDTDCVIINTCGFIESAKAEAIENILELAQIKAEGRIKALVVTGCLAERYKEQVMEQMPEIDAVVGLGSNSDIVEIVTNAIEGNKSQNFKDKHALCIEGERMLSTPFYTAYLKIAEGCDNCCTYCTIPMIRGRFRSRSLESVVSEAENLAKRGVKELILVAQDTTRYGQDLYSKPMLAELLNRLNAIEGIEWIRMLYTYPERIDDELINAVKNNDKVVSYFDIPLQHCNKEILQKMNRKGDEQSYLELVARLRKALPDVTLRTTFITGFPGESEEQFEQLCNFVKKARFDRVGCFAYSQEEDTVAGNMQNQIDPQVRQRRSEVIMDVQNRVINSKNEQYIDTVQRVLVEGYDDYIKCCFGRTKADAPEIDAKVFFTPKQARPQAGDFVDVRVIDTIEYDLLAEQI